MHNVLYAAMVQARRPRKADIGACCCVVRAAWLRGRRAFGPVPPVLLGERPDGRALPADRTRPRARGGRAGGPDPAGPRRALRRRGHGDLDAGEYQTHRGVCETEAESTAYVLANLLDLDVDASSIRYIAGWSKADIQKFVYERTQNSVAHLKRVQRLAGAAPRAFRQRGFACLSRANHECVASAHQSTLQPPAPPPDE